MTEKMQKQNYNYEDKEFNWIIIFAIIFLMGFFAGLFLGVILEQKFFANQIGKLVTSSGVEVNIDFNQTKFLEDFVKEMKYENIQG